MSGFTTGGRRGGLEYGPDIEFGGFRESALCFSKRLTNINVYVCLVMFLFLFFVFLFQEILLQIFFCLTDIKSVFPQMKYKVCIFFKRFHQNCLFSVGEHTGCGLYIPLF